MNVVHWRFFLLYIVYGLCSEKPSELTISSEQQLNQLTDFVSFLENWLLLLRNATIEYA